MWQNPGIKPVKLNKSESNRELEKNPAPVYLQSYKSNRYLFHFELHCRRHYKKHSLLLSLSLSHTHTHTHTRTYSHSLILILSFHDRREVQLLCCWFSLQYTQIISAVMISPPFPPYFFFTSSVSSWSWTKVLRHLQARYWNLKQQFPTKKVP